MKNRSCIIIGALYESAQVHLTQTPVWNAFWVTCCLALMSVILKSSRDRTLVDLSGRFMGCYRHPPSPAPFLLHFVLTASDACCDSGDWCVINGPTHFQAFRTVRRAGLQGQLTPQASRVKFRGTFKQMVFGVQSVTREEPGKRRKVTLKH